MATVKYPIPQRHLTTAIESLRELALRLELEASAFAQLPYRDAGALARDRLELVGASGKGTTIFCGCWWCGLASRYEYTFFI